MPGSKRSRPSMNGSMILVELDPPPFRALITEAVWGGVRDPCIASPCTFRFQDVLIPVLPQARQPGSKRSTGWSPMRSRTERSR